MLINKRNSISSMRLSFMICGFFVFYLGYMLRSYLFQNEQWPRLISLIGIVIIFATFWEYRKNLKGCDIHWGYICNFYLLICLLHIIIGVPLGFTKGNTTLLLFSSQFFYSFFIGYMMLLRLNLNNISVLFRWSLVYIIVSLLFNILNFNDLFLNPSTNIANMEGWDASIINRPQEPALLFLPISAFLIYYKCFELKWKIIIPIVFILSLLACMLSGRRSVSVTLVALAVLPFIIAKYKITNIMVTILFLIIIFTLILSQIDSLNSLWENMFPVLSNRLDAQTRTGIERNFYNDMIDPIDWIFGRGMNGTYYCPTVSGIVQLHRGIIETGYLNMILHGGLIMLISYVYLLCYAFIKGYYYSKNMFVKSCAVYIFLHILLLYPDGMPKLTYEYFILFIFVRICVSTHWREKSNLQIKAAMFK